MTAALLENITLIVGVDARHLEELRWTWPTWVSFKPEILSMRAIIFYDTSEVDLESLQFLMAHPRMRLVPWEMPLSESQREKMLSGFVHVAATEVRTEWYLKLDTDVIATGPERWIDETWFTPNARGELPEFIAARWGYSKPRYVMDLLDDWADRVPALACFPRLDLPYDSAADRVRHRRIISWLFFGRTAAAIQARCWLGPTGRLPFPSHDTFLFYCAHRARRHYVRERMNAFGWTHTNLSRIRRLVKQMGVSPVAKRALKTTFDLETRTHASTQPSAGVVYYNTGTSCAVRLLVSIFSLRQHYAGPVTILSEGEASHALCLRIAEALGAHFKQWDCGIPEGANRAFLAKTRYHEGSPYETTVALDCDTLVRGAIEPLFAQAERGTFCVALAKWRSDGQTIAKRIRQWAPWLPDDIEPALRFGPAVNCGVVAFQRKAHIFREWSSAALRGRETFIPDEVSCQILLHRFPHRVLDPRWNCSCRHDNPTAPGTRIIHYHGRKHCRPGLPFNANLWVANFNAVRRSNLADIQSWLPAGDTMLRRLLKSQRAGKAIVSSSSENYAVDGPRTIR